MNLISKIIAAVRAAISCRAAEDQMVKRRFREATRSLERAYSIMNFERPSIIAPFDLNILSAQLAIEMSNGPIALKSSQVALEQIGKVRGNASVANYEYTKRYCEFLVKYCEFWRDGISTLELSRMVIPTDGVDHLLLQKYPPPQAKRSR
jgi:hypothetical protein